MLGYLFFYVVGPLAVFAYVGARTLADRIRK